MPQWIQVLLLIKWVYETGLKAWKAISKLIRKNNQDKEINEMKKAEDKIKDANQIENDEERLKKKAEAMCEIEKAINPKSDC